MSIKPVHQVNNTLKHKQSFLQSKQRKADDNSFKDVLLSVCPEYRRG